MEQVKNVVPLGYWDMIANRLYYAAYYAVSALLLQAGHSVQTHHGIIQMLGLHFIKTGILDSKYGTLYGQLFSLRQTGDYGDTFGLTEAQVLPLVPQTEELIKAVASLINEKYNKQK
ncbi:MAG: HEPN domain-containing protein [Bacteroidales bacterium]|nr:HEPN domain-containing protein [Bacteroidales bacterium]